MPSTNLTNQSIETLNFNGIGQRCINVNNIKHYVIIDAFLSMDLTERPEKYLTDLFRKMKKEGFVDSDFIGLKRLRILSKDGRKKLTYCADFETMLRLLQSINSPKVEKYKRWIAKAAANRIKQRENPELAIDQAYEDYKAQGKDDKWIAARIKGKIKRKNCTSYLQDEANVKDEKQIAALTGITNQAGIGMNATKFKKINSLPTSAITRDHLPTACLSFLEMGESLIVELSRDKRANGYEEVKPIVTDISKIIRNARESYEQILGKRLITT